MIRYNKLMSGKTTPAGRTSMWAGAILAGTVLLSLCGCTGNAESLDHGATRSTGAMGRQCEAGIYSCTLPRAAALGSRCSCPGLGAPSYGVVHAD